MLSRKQKAFTLLELIVVIVVLGILSALAVPAFTTVKENSRKGVAIRNWEATARQSLAERAFDQGTAGTYSPLLSMLSSVDGSVYEITDANGDGVAESAAK